ncbi:MAG: nucleoside-diphosphate kinase [Candidatus Hodarchaeales archaeon]|jgi:nucleoside-diphosphate kinase
MGIENTFVMIKPDAVHRGLIGEVISRFEKKGLKLRAMKFLQIDRPLAEKLYDIHKERPFFNDLVDFIISGPIVVMVWSAPRAVAMVRHLLGATKSFEANPGTIRGDYGIALDKNIVHASDAPDRAKYEYNLFFNVNELVNWTMATGDWF